MKNLIQYLKLWRKKRDELRVDTDAGSDWLDMKALLDEHMPANDSPGGASPKRGISFLSTILITLAAAAMLYFAYRAIDSKKKAVYHKDILHNKKRGFTSGVDSLMVANSLQKSENPSLNGDSASAVQNNAVTTPDNRLNKNNSNSSVKADSVDIGNIPAKSNSDNRKKVIDKQNSTISVNPSQLTNDKKLNSSAGTEEGKNNVKTNTDLLSNSPDLPNKSVNDKKLNLPADKVKGINSSPTNAQRPDLLANSPHLVNKPNNGKKLNSIGGRGKGRNNTQTNELSRDLSSNSSHLLNKPDNGKKPNLLNDGNNGKKHLLAKLSGSNPNVFADNRNRFATNKSNTETNQNHNQHYTRDNQTVLLIPTGQHAGINSEMSNTYATLTSKLLIQTNIAGSSKAKNNKSKTYADNSNIIWEWGVLIGANSNGSFTSKSQNKNFYGSLPADVFTGLYGNYNFSPKWGVGTQVNILSPQTENGGTYAGLFLNTTGGITTVDFKSIDNSRKVYSIQVPVYAVYHLTKNIGFKAGPVINFPIKQVSTITSADTVNNPILVTAQYHKTTNYSFLDGINYRYKRLIFEADYLKGLTKHNIISDTLIHQGTNNTFQFSIKLQLGGKKK